MRYPLSNRLLSRRAGRPARVVALGALAAVAIAMASCGPSTTIEQTWRAPITQYQGKPPLHRVATLFLSNNTTLRRSAEDQLARDLIAQGVQAAPGYRLVSDEELTDLDAVKDKLRQRGFDGVVTMRIVDREEQLEYAPDGGYWGGWGYSGSWGYGGYYSPGYAYTETIYRLETNAYSLETDQLMWSALTRTVDPANARQLIDDTTKVIAGELTGLGLAG